MDSTPQPDTSPQTEPSPSVPPTDPHTRKPKRRLPLILGGLLLLVLGGAGGYLIARSNLPQKQPVTAGCTMDAKVCPDGTSVGRTGPDCEFAACPTPAGPDEIIDWQLFSDPAQGFSFRHPHGATTETRQEGPGTTTILLYIGPTQLASGRTQTELADGYKFTVQTAPLTEDTDLNQAAEKGRNGILNVGYGDNCQVTPVSAGTLDGQQTAEYTATDCYGNARVVFTKANSRSYTITGLYAGDGYDRTVDMILSTFRFMKPQAQ